MAGKADHRTFWDRSGTDSGQAPTACYLEMIAFDPDGKIAGIDFQAFVQDK